MVAPEMGVVLGRLVITREGADLRLCLEAIVSPQALPRLTDVSDPVVRQSALARLRVELPRLIPLLWLADNQS
jgi:hypothetical protein